MLIFFTLFRHFAGSTAEGLEVVYSGDVFETLQAVMTTNDTVRYRVYQVGKTTFTILAVKL